MPEIKELEKQYLEADILVVGGGVTGCFAALQAAERGLKAVLISKSLVGKGGCSRSATNLAGGPPQAYMSPEAREELGKVRKEVRDEPRRELPEKQKALLSMFCAYLGHYLLDQDYALDASAWTREYFYNWFEEHGLYIRRMADGSLISSTGPVHQKQVWAPRQGQTGPQLMDLLRHEVFAHDNIRVVEECRATGLLTQGGEVTGGVGLGMRDGKLYVISAGATFLCTGQAARVTTRTTATREVFGEGYVMALDAGAELKDLELWFIHVVDNKDPITFNQHCYPNPNPNTDKTPHMFNSYGEFFFTPDQFTQGTTAMYHLQYKRSVQQIMQGKAKWDGEYYSSYRHMVGEFDGEYQGARRALDHLGFMNVGEEMIENAMNFEANFIGGIRVDEKTQQTRVPGLYAPGGAGGHSSFVWCCYCAHVATGHAEKRVRDMGMPQPAAEQVREVETRLLGSLRAGPEGGYHPGVVMTKIRRVMTEALFPWKNEEKLQTGLEELRRVEEEMLPQMGLESTGLNYNQGWLDAIDVPDMLEFCGLLLLASLERKESRGPFFRDDYPYTDNENWLAHNVVAKVDGKPEFRRVPAELKYVRPEGGRVDYFKAIY